MRTVYKNANNGTLDIIVEDEKIAYLGLTAEEGIDLKGDSVYPGLIDIHIHGCVGYDTMDQNGFDEMSAFLVKNGTTAWLPTTMTADMQAVKQIVNTLPQTKGAQILGYHMEGPYIAAKYKGAQKAEFIKLPDIDEFNTLRHIKMVTLAPELTGSLAFIQQCKSIVSIGHTDADYDTARTAILSGARCLTHTFNAMPPFHHRAPGPIGAAIEENIFVQVICDGIHLHKSVVLALYKLFGAERMILISDSMRACGMPDGNYEFGGQKIRVQGKIARTEDGTLAGSTSTLLDCVKKAIEFGIPYSDAFRMASQTPAALLGMKKGKLAVGYDADFISVGQNLTPTAVIVKGRRQIIS